MRQIALVIILESMSSNCGCARKVDGWMRIGCDGCKLFVDLADRLIGNLLFLICFLFERKDMGIVGGVSPTDPPHAALVLR